MKLSKHINQTKKRGGKIMNLDKFVLMFAGFMVLISLVLTKWHHPYWMWLTVFVGVNMIQASITGFCPAAFIFKKLGIKGGYAFK
jgi:Flp pilus assembly protein TadB